MRDYTISKKRRDLAEKYPLRLTPESLRAMKALMRAYPTQSINTIINTLIVAAGESSKAVAQ